MSLNPMNAQLIAKLTAKYSLGGRLLHFGRLFPIEHVSYGMVVRLAEEAGKTEFDIGGEASDTLIPDEGVYFRALEYENHESLDFIETENPTHVFDMNSPELPDELRGRYDVIYNNGTIEHIFHIPNCLANVTRMLDVGGYIIHNMPANNSFDHGFYQFSPCLLFDYYAANGFDIAESVVYRRDDKHIATDWVPWREEEYYCPYDLEQRYQYDGKLDGGVYTMIFVARKTEISAENQVPFQGQYAVIFDRSDSSNAGRDTMPGLLLKGFTGQPPGAGIVKPETETPESARKEITRQAEQIKNLSASIDEANQVIQAKDQQIERMQQYEATLLRQILELQGISIEDE